jgi:hypothetical protein
MNLFSTNTFNAADLSLDLELESDLAVPVVAEEVNLYGRGTP